MAKRLLDKAFWVIAFHLPKKLVYCCALRLMAYATQGEYSDTVVPELLGMTALQRWSSDMWGWA